MYVSSILQLNSVIPYFLVFETCWFCYTEDFFKDLQQEFRNWEANTASQGKPKSVWKELAVRLPAYIFIRFDAVPVLFPKKKKMHT